jgi:FecR protein
MTLIIGVLLAAPLGGLLSLSRSVTADTSFGPGISVDHGTVTIVRDSKPYKTNGSTVLVPGDTVVTSWDGLATIWFPDGSRAQLGPSTSVIFVGAFLGTQGQLSATQLTQLSGRTLESVMSTPGRRFEVDTPATGVATSRAVFEVDVDPKGLTTVRVFDGAVGTSSANIGAHQQQYFDPYAGALTAVEQISEDPYDQLVQAVNAEVAARQLNQDGVLVETYPSASDAVSSTVLSAASVPIGGGDIVAVVTSPLAAQLTVTSPGHDVHSAQGQPPVAVRIRNGPPGIYQAQVSALDPTQLKGPYAVAFVLPNVCTSAAEDGYVRQFVGVDEMARSVHVSGLWLHALKFTSRGDEVLFDADGLYLGLPVALRGVIYAAAPEVRVLLLSVKVFGLREPAVSVGALTAKQIGLPITGYKVARLHACRDGFVIEGRP